MGVILKFNLKNTPKKNDISCRTEIRTETEIDGYCNIPDVEEQETHPMNLPSQSFFHEWSI